MYKFNYTKDCFSTCLLDTNTSTFKDEIVMVKDFSCDRVLTKEEKKLKAIEDKFVYFDDIEDEECPTLVEDRGHRSISELGTIVDVFKFHMPQLAISCFLYFLL